MEKLRGDSLSSNIHSAMEMWMEGIRKVQARRKEEIVNAANRHRNGGPRHQEDKGRLDGSCYNLVFAVLPFTPFNFWVADILL